MSNFWKSLRDEQFIECGIESGIVEYDGVFHLEIGPGLHAIFDKKEDAENRAIELLEQQDFMERNGYERCAFLTWRKNGIIWRMI